MAPKRAGDSRRIPISQKFFYGVFLACIIVAVILYIGQVRSYRESQRELEELKEDLVELKEGKEELEEEVELLHDEDYIERQARKKLGLIHPGEIRFIVENEEKEEDQEQEDLE